MTIAQDFVNALKPKEQPTPYDTQATITRIEDGVAWVHIAGGVDETPVKLTINASEGQTVQVRVADGTAFLVGNESAPPTDDRVANVALETAEDSANISNLAIYRAEEAGKVANNYISADNTGMMVADMADGQQLPSEATGRNVFIDNHSVDIRDGQTVLASFGENVLLGDENETNLKLSKSRFQMINRINESIVDFQIINDVIVPGTPTDWYLGTPIYTLGKRSSYALSDVGEYSCAIGKTLIAKGNASVALNTGNTANGNDQTVIGHFNKADTTSAFIIGNGTSTESSGRSNALAVDWVGNINAAGDVYVNGNHRIGEYIAESPSSAVSIQNGTATAVTSVTLGAGVWVIYAKCRFQNNATGYRRLNLSTTRGNATNELQIPAVSGAATDLVMNKIVNLSSQSTIYLNAYQNSGTTLSSSTSEIRAVRIA